MAQLLGTVVYHVDLALVACASHYLNCEASKLDSGANTRYETCIHPISDSQVFWDSGALFFVSFSFARNNILMIFPGQW